MKDSIETMDSAMPMRFWAHMLDESSHASYYKVYMAEHPEDKPDTLADSLISQFAEDLKRDKIDLNACVKNGMADMHLVEEMQSKIKHRYVWDRIKAQEYAAIVSRMTALMHKSKGQRYNENEIDFDTTAHFVSRRTVERCLDIICHNTNVLEVNGVIVLRYDITKHKAGYEHLFKKHGIPAVPNYSPADGKVVDDFYPAVMLYKAWASYAKGAAGEKYVCDSDTGPEALKKILDNVEYAADDIDLAVALNKALDVVHFRSDLAAAFIEGGQQTCSMVSNLPNGFVV